MSSRRPLRPLFLLCVMAALAAVVLFVFTYEQVTAEHRSHSILGTVKQREVLSSRCYIVTYMDGRVVLWEGQLPKWLLQPLPK